MKVKVDRQKCRGHGQCVLIAPDVFDLDDQDRSVVLAEDVPADLESTVEDAVLMCPEGAIETG